LISENALRMSVTTFFNAHSALIFSRPTVSRVSILTGLSRKEVSRVRDLPEPDDQGATERYNRAARVVSGWVRDEMFHDDRGCPADLPVDGDGKSFAALVKRYSGDVPPRAILDELARVEAVRLAEKGKVARLMARAYVPSSGTVEKLGILGTDVADLVATIDLNITGEKPGPFIQRKVSYDNLPVESLARIRKLSATEGQKLLELLDVQLSEMDRDAGSSIEGTGRMRAGLGIYYFEEDLDAEKDA
jgi:hypothetical protein